MKYITTLIILSNIFSQDITNPNGFKFKENENNERQSKENYLLNIPIKLYRYFANSIKKADYCQFHPTCSYYGEKAVQNIGLLGWLMAFDRLNRSGHDLHLYDRVIVKDKIKYLDTVD